jgi:hypothetical protein
MNWVKSRENAFQVTRIVCPLFSPPTTPALTQVSITFSMDHYCCFLTILLAHSLIPLNPCSFQPQRFPTRTLWWLPPSTKTNFLHKARCDPISSQVWASFSASLLLRTPCFNYQSHQTIGFFHTDPCAYSTLPGSLDIAALIQLMCHIAWAQWPFSVLPLHPACVHQWLSPLLELGIASWVWCFTPVISALRRLWHKDWEFETSLGYIVGEGNEKKKKDCF